MNTVVIVCVVYDVAAYLVTWRALWLHDEMYGRPDVPSAIACVAIGCFWPLTISASLIYAAFSWCRERGR